MRSKLGIHINSWYRRDQIYAFADTAGPAVAVALDFDRAHLKYLKDKGWLIIGRVYASDQEIGSNPSKSCDTYYKRKLEGPVGDYGDLVDAWIGYNEVGASPYEKLARYAEFECRRIELLKKQGAKAVVGNFSCGTPQVEDWPAFYPALECALANGGYLGLHEYSAPTMDWCYGLNQWNHAENRPFSPGELGLIDEGNTGWLTFRYRKVYNSLPEHLKKVRLIITETGVDGGVTKRPGPPGGGWRHFAEYWAQQGKPDPIAEYMAQLQWYDAGLRQDDFVVGATIYCMSAGDDWASFDIEGDMATKVATYMRDLVQAPPPPEEPEEPGDDLMIDYTKQYSTIVRNDLPNRSAADVKEICIHHIAADNVTAEALLGYLKTKGTGYHVYIRSDGTAYLFADMLNKVMFHNGYGPKSPHGNYSQYNWEQVGIGFEGLLMGGKEPTPAQFATAKEVIRSIWKDTGRQVPIRAHKNYGPTLCPGSWWQGNIPDPRLLPVVTLPNELEQLRAEVVTLKAQIAKLELAISDSRTALLKIVEIATREANV